MHDFEVFITITGLNHYSNSSRLFEGQILTLRREENNEFDKNAVAVFSDNEKIGYVANSKSTIFSGTMSANELVEIMNNEEKAMVVEASYGNAVCKVINLFNVDKMCLKAFEYYSNGEYPDAYNLFVIINEKFDSVLLLQYITDCLIKMEKYSDAICYIEEAVNLEKENKVSLMMYGTILEKLNLTDKALGIYKTLYDIENNKEVENAIKRCSKEY